MTNKKKNVTKNLMFVPFEQFNNVYQADRLKCINSEQNEIDISYSEEKLVMVKYMPFSRFEDSIKNNYIYFASPDEWEDTFEHLFPTKVNVEEEGSVVIRCTCFTMTDFGNEEGFWKLYSIDKNEPVVAVTYNVKALFKELDKIGHKFYLNGVSYMPRTKIIEKLEENKETASLNDYLQLLSYKRFAFGHEQELRLFVVKEEENSDESLNEIDNFRKVHIDYSKNVIESVTMPPLKPLSKTEVDYNNYETKQDESNKKLKNDLSILIKENGINCKVLQSALYITKKIEELDADKYFVGQ